MSLAALRSEVRTLRRELDAMPTVDVDPADDSRRDWATIARPNQLPPNGIWTYWIILTGRGWGKTRTGSEQVRSWINKYRYVNLIGATMDDAVSIMIEGESGVLECCPDHERPRYISNKRQLRWPNGAKSLVFSADEPDRLRGKQHMKLWADELASWRYPEAWDQAQFGLRLGDHPQAIVTTTPQPRKFIKELIAHPRCVVVRGSTTENRDNLAPAFYASILAKYQGTRLGRQEIDGEVIDIPEGAWFQNFSDARHVTTGAEYQPGVPVQLGVDIGTGRFCAAVIAQAVRVDDYRIRFNVLGDYLAEGLYSEANAKAILDVVMKLCPAATVHMVWCDPAASQRTGIGPAALGEVERVFGPRHVSRSPQAGIVDGLDQLEILLDHEDLVVHPRCVHVVEAFKNYVRAQRAGEYLDAPASPQNPAEDVMDSLRYLCRAVQPEGRRPRPQFRRVHASLAF